MGFHTILWSKLNIKIQQHISLVLHVVYYALLSLHRCGGLFALFSLHRGGDPLHATQFFTRVVYYTLLKSPCFSTGVVTTTIFSGR